MNLQKNLHVLYHCAQSPLTINPQLPRIFYMLKIDFRPFPFQLSILGKTLIFATKKQVFFLIQVAPSVGQTCLHQNSEKLLLKIVKFKQFSLITGLRDQYFLGINQVQKNSGFTGNLSKRKFKWAHACQLVQSLLKEECKR
eukprot:XP_015574615.1 uncharacterized protein LOC107261241 [Ricinus communis]